MTARISAQDAHLLPHDEEAERSVIGSLLIDPDAILRTEEAGLAATDFYDRRLGWIYEAAQALAMRREPVDAFTVAREVERAPDSADGNRLALLGGDAEITALIAGTPSSVHAGYYAEIVVRDARRRRLIAAGAEVAAASHQHEGDLSELYDLVSQILFGAMERSDADSHLYGGSQALGRYLDNQKQRATHRSSID